MAPFGQINACGGEVNKSPGTVLVIREVRREVFMFYYKPFLLCDLCALCGAKKYSDISWQDFTFWQPYFQMKKPYLHPGKVVFS
jgi:hypothetical protein